MSQGLNIAILTVSDSRTLKTDTSGQYLADAIKQAGHSLSARDLVNDDVYRLRAVVSNWIADDTIEAILITGGTGFTERDLTPEAIEPLLDVEIEGFGELFRQLSYGEIGTSSIQSRALGGMANNTLVFCMPGSTGACKTGWERIIRDQLDITHKPCNLAELVRQSFYTHGGPHPHGGSDE